jgi:parallel beta-helix repeat protein
LLSILRINIEGGKLGLGYGIVVDGNSSAYIGIPGHYATVASPNTIEDNRVGGIYVGGSSDAYIVGNTISYNTDNGIVVSRVSHAYISDNTINRNGQNGILVSQNSGVNLGRDTGTTIFDLPNTTTLKNGDKGLMCSSGGYMDGRRGTLNGARGRVIHDGTCIDSLGR